MEPVKLFQYNTLGALMAGLYGGSFTIGELLEHGDLGVGPFFRTAQWLDAALGSGGAFRVQAAARVPKYAEPS